MGFLGTAASSFADAVLILQITGFILLFTGVLQVKKGNFPEHYRMAYAAVILGVISFIWMSYSLSRSFGALLSSFTASGSLLTVLHIIVGTGALVSGIFFAFNRVIKKTIYPMRIVFLLWTSALFIGIAVYSVNYIT